MGSHADSLLLVWRIADFEAKNLHATAIEPAHFLLGLLKVVDVDLSKAADLLRKELDVNRAVRHVGDLRSAFSYIGVDPKLSRRMLRKRLSVGSSQGDNEKRILRRSSESRKLFAEIESMGNEVNALHLLITLAKRGDPFFMDIMKRSKSSHTKLLEFLSWL